MAQAALVKNSRDLNSAMEQLSTGRRINSAADNASGLAITNRMTSQINGLGAAIRNANDAVSMISTAEGALEEITEMLQRMREVAVQSGTGTTSEDDRTYLNAEFDELRSEIDRIAMNTEWNGRAILDGAAGGTSTSTVVFQVGVDGGQTLTVAFGNIQNGSTGTMSGLAANSLTGATVASGMANALMLSLLLIQRSRPYQTSELLLVQQQTITHAVDNLTNVKVNAEASRSRIWILIMPSQQLSWHELRSFSRQVQRCSHKQTSCRRPC